MGIKAQIRWTVVVIALTCIVLLWFLSGVETVYSWEDVLDALRIHNRERYTRTAALGVLAIVVVSLLRLFRKKE